MTIDTKQIECGHEEGFTISSNVTLLDDALTIDQNLTTTRAKITFTKQDCSDEVCETTSLEIGKEVRVLIDYGRPLDQKYKLKISKERFKFELIHSLWTIERFNFHQKINQLKWSTSIP